MGNGIVSDIDKIEAVLAAAAEVELNLGSETARKILAERIPYLDENICSLSVKKNMVQVSINYKNKISFLNIKKKILEIINSFSDHNKLIKNEVLYQSKNYKIKKKDRLKNIKKEKTSRNMVDQKVIRKKYLGCTNAHHAFQLLRSL